MLCISKNGENAFIFHLIGCLFFAISLVVVILSIINRKSIENNNHGTNNFVLVWTIFFGMMVVSRLDGTLQIIGVSIITMFLFGIVMQNGFTDRVKNN
jgi:hypothetical protein